MSENWVTEAVKSKKLPKAKFERLLAGRREDFKRQDNLRDIQIALAGSEENAQALFAEGGIGIGAFGQMVGLPVSTVRHYVRLGLIEPWEVDGRYRFEPVNVAQVESVRQWAELGLTLEEIIARRQAQRAERPGILLMDAVPAGEPPEPKLAYVQRELGAEGMGLRISEESHVWRGELFTSEHDTEGFQAIAIARELAEEYRAARARLEAKRSDLEGKIARALELEERLGRAVG